MPRATTNRGFSLIEVLIVIGIFSVLMAAVSVTFSTQVRHGSREYRIGESEVELGIVKNLLERDIALAGYGLADDYGTTGFVPRSAAAAAGSLTLTGTALGLTDRAPLHWSYATEAAPTFKVWGDSREDLVATEQVILLEPNTEQILTQGGAPSWRFQYNSSSSLKDSGGAAWASPTIGTLVYGVAPGATQPFATVTYSLNTANLPSNCATGTSNLERTESWGGAAVTIPLLACTLSLQTAFGLDTDEDENGTIDLWDNAGAVASGYSQATLAKRLKQVRVYLLVQIGNRDASYTYPAATVRVGDSLLGTGATVNLSAEQRRFRWRLVSIDMTPRNVR